MVAAKDFVHLHLHSEYSLLDGANRIPALVQRARELGMDALALTDHGNMFGALAFQRAAKAAGLKPILGCEVYVAAGSRHDRRPGAQRRTHHLLLLAKDLTGYRNLCKLSSIGFTEGFHYKPRVDLEALAAHREGLVASSACLKGMVPVALRENRLDQAERIIGQHIEIFGAENYFLEVMDHGLPEQHTVNRHLVALAKRFGLGLVATNDAHYLCRTDAELQDALLCIQMGKTLSDEDRLRFRTDQFYVKDPQEMCALFAELPEAILNTRRIAEMCNAEIPTGQHILPRYDCPDGQSEEAYLRALVAAGLAARYPRLGEEIRARADYELGVIERMGLAGYFLIVWDFVKFAKEQGIPVGPGRGSAAGSIVSYALGITDIDPLAHGLLFERFLNPGRKSMPDIDIDFCFERRGEVIEYVRRRYGERNVAQIITFGTLKAKAAIRDVGRILGVPLPEVDRLARLVPDGPNVRLETALRDVPELRAAVEESEVNRRLFALARAVEGSIRQASTHAAGIVIADRDLTDHIPVYMQPGTTNLATQFTMTEIEEIGLLKMDFLGLKNLTIIDNTVRQVARTRGVTVDWAAIGFDDPATYALLCSGDTDGVFQLESPGMRGLVQQVKPSRFSDLVAILALYRPGPLESGMAAMFAERKHGRQRIVYDHPKLEPILRETYGVILYQEQVMQIAVDLAGFSLAEADTLRKAMGKKIKAVMEKQEAKFLAGCQANGVDADLARRIWDQIVTFAGYGFNKSHSAAYAVITYRTAYLKAHFPVEYMAAQLTNEISGSNATESIARYMAVCRPMGIRILPPDVNESFAEFTVVGGDIRFGLEAIKNVGHGAAQAIVEARATGGPFTSLQDLAERVDQARVNAKAIECLIKSGALDSLGLRRSQMMAMLPQVLELGTALARERDSGQTSLFGAGEVEAPRPMHIEPPDLPEWPDQERLAHEKELLGQYLTGHPLDRHAELLRGLDRIATVQIPQVEPGKSVHLLALVRAIRPITTKRGDRMAFVTVEDYEGVAEVIVFSDPFERHRELLRVDQVLWLRGKIQARNGDKRLSVEEAMLPEQAAQSLTRWFTVALPHVPEVTPPVRALLDRLEEALRRRPGPQRVRLRVSAPEGVVDMPTALRVAPDAALEAEVRALRAELEALALPLTAV